MTLLPFLILGLGAFWVVLLLAAQDNRVVVPRIVRVLERTVRFAASLAAMGVTMARAAISTQKFGEAMRGIHDTTKGDASKCLKSPH